MKLFDDFTIIINSMILHGSASVLIIIAAAVAFCTVFLAVCAFTEVKKLNAQQASADNAEVPAADDND